MNSVASPPRTETHTIRDGEALQIGDTLVFLKTAGHDRATLKVVEPDGRKIKRVDRPAPQPVELPR